MDPITDSVIDTVAKYFYFSCLDEQVSFAASLRVLSELRGKNQLEIKHRDRWVEVLAKWKQRLPSLHGRAWADKRDQRGFQIPPGFDMGAWMTFIASCEPTEVEAVLLSRLLGFNDEEIAAGLGVTVGTVRYRVGRGLRHLGGFLEP
ncbi:MAG: sigma factor-like helix-turn-helix DNA-binding protein [Bdellovibrionales bacterium]